MVFVSCYLGCDYFFQYSRWSSRGYGKVMGDHLTAEICHGWARWLHAGSSDVVCNCEKAAPVFGATDLLLSLSHMRSPTDTIDDNGHLLNILDSAP
jgi:hypothetical protein